MRPTLLIRPFQRSSLPVRHRLVANNPHTIPSTRASFTAFAPSRLKEDKEQSPEELEQAKKNQNQSSKAREELSSKSESAVAADQEKVRDHDKHIEELQKDTAKESEKEHPQGKR